MNSHKFTYCCLPRRGGSPDTWSGDAGTASGRRMQMAIWDDWSTFKKTRAVVGLIGIAAIFIYAAIRDAMNW